MEDSQLTKTLVSPKLNILVIVTCFIIFVPSTFNQRVNAISLYVLIPLLFAYSVVKTPKLIANNKPIIYFLLLLCWSLLTMIKSTDMDSSIREIKRLVGTFLLCFIFVRFSFINAKYIYVFYLFYILQFFTMFYYALTHGLQVTDERFNLGELNANTLGYFGFFSIISAFFLWQNVPLKSVYKLFLFVIFLLCISLSVIACFYAASRAGIVMSLLIAVALILIYSFYPFSKKFVFGIILLVVISTAIIPFLNHYYKGSILEQRMRIESLDDEARYGLIIRALDLGIKNPLFGVGPANFAQYNGGSFSHSTYTELFANNGIVGLIIFLSLFYYYFKKNRLLYSLGKDQRKIAMYFYSFIILYSLYNLFYGFHTHLYLMGFFFLVLVHMEVSLEQEED